MGQVAVLLEPSPVLLSPQQQGRSHHNRRHHILQSAAAVAALLLPPVPTSLVFENVVVVHLRAFQAQSCFGVDGVGHPRVRTPSVALFLRIENGSRQLHSSLVGRS